MLAELTGVFEAHQQEGRVRFDCESEIYLAQVGR